MLYTVEYDRCDDGKNWHIFTPDHVLHSSYKDEFEAEFNAVDLTMMQFPRNSTTFEEIEAKYAKHHDHS